MDSGLVLSWMVTPVVVLMSLAGCTPPPQIAPPPTWSPTQAPTPLEKPAPTDVPTLDLMEYCLGWDCEIDGVVYEGQAIAGNELEGVVVQFRQGSYCSPTRGEYEAVTGPNGEFSFEVYLHDTDSFRFSVDIAGYEPALVSFGGFDCLYCSCPPVAVELQPLEATPATP